MSESNNHNYDTVESPHRSTIKFLDMIILLGVGCLLITIIIVSAQTRESEQALADIKAEQVAESRHYTAVVTAVDMTNGTVTLDNGDIMSANTLEMTPHIGDVLAYTKTFEYEHDEWYGTVKRTNQDAFLNVESIGQVSK